MPGQPGYAGSRGAARSEDQAEVFLGGAGESVGMVALQVKCVCAWCIC